MKNSKIVARLAVIAGLLILAMFAVTVLTGVSQEKFEIVQHSQYYAKVLLADQMPLRLIFSIDLVFIPVFTTLFIILTPLLKTGERVTDTLANAALGAMLVCSALDFYEDLHILTMLDSAAKYIPIPQSDISAQMTLSTYKFCASYLALFLLAFVLPQKTLPEKLLRYSLWFVQLPVGVLVYTAPTDFHLIFNLLRFVFMISGFFLLAYNFSRYDETSEKLKTES